MPVVDQRHIWRWDRLAGAGEGGRRASLDLSRLASHPGQPKPASVPAVTPQTVLADLPAPITAILDGRMQACRLYGTGEGIEPS
jgi:hypothetical protein